jgi:hypothetical protein
LKLWELGHQVVGALQKIKTSSYIVLDTELPQIGKRLKPLEHSAERGEPETIKSAIYT